MTLSVSLFLPYYLPGASSQPLAIGCKIVFLDHYKATLRNRHIVDRSMLLFSCLFVQTIVAVVLE